MASGLAIPCPAMSGAEPWTGSNRPGGVAAEATRWAAGPSEPVMHRRLVAEDVAEHVLGDDHVEVARRGDELHRGESTRSVLELDLRELLGVDAADDLAPEAARLQDVGLVDARDPRCARLWKAVRAMRSTSPTVYSQRSVAASSVRVLAPK